MRAYFVVTLVILVAYFFVRPFTPFWLDGAFIGWCLAFVVVWKKFRDRNRAARDEKEEATQN